MSVLVVTSLGDIVIDLHTDRCPLTTKNFLKLCKIKYYNGCLFHNVQKDFTAQTGDPTGKGTGGDSVYKFLYGDQARFFGDEIHPDLKHSKTGTVSMASAGENLNASQFYFTLRDDLDYLDGKHTVFGEVVEGLDDTLMRINEAYVDDKGRPYKNIRIKHTYILDDPFVDPPQLAELVPEASPEGKPLDELEEVRLEDDWVPMDEQLGPSELEEALRMKEAHSSAVVLETIGDIPEAEIKPPENVLFVCKLNPVTQDEDLNTIFSRFGNVVSADIIRDYKTGDSLCYAFIEFENVEACEQAYFKMDNALIDDRRIHVDFSQSVSKLWSQYRQKGNQAGRGCFKCGALDHIAKDCTGGSDAKQPPPKYILKDNMEHGGDDLKGYEMLFDEDATGRPEQERHRDRETGEKNEKWKVGNQRSEDHMHRDRDKKDSTSDRYRHDRKSREHREAEKNQRDRGSKQSLGRRDDEHHGGRSTSLEQHGDGENGKRRHDSSRLERDEREYRKRSREGDRNSNSDHEKENRKKHDSSRRERDERDYGKKSREGDRSKYLDQEDNDNGKRQRDSGLRRGRGERERDERDYRKRSIDDDRDSYSDHRHRDEKRR